MLAGPQFSPQEVQFGQRQSSCRVVLVVEQGLAVVPGREGKGGRRRRRGRERKGRDGGGRGIGRGRGGRMGEGEGTGEGGERTDSQHFTDF